LSVHKLIAQPSFAWRPHLQHALGAVVLAVGLLLVSMTWQGEPMAEAAPLPLETGLLASTAVTYTQYLPFVARIYDPRTPPFGIQFYGNALGEKRLEYAVTGGAQWVRWPLSWASIEPVNTTPEDYNWSSLDGVVNHATVNGVQLILTIAGQPSWAAVYEMGPVTDTDDLLEFVSALVERYDGDGVADAPGSPQVQYFELYNEPDNVCLDYAEHGGWGYWGYNAAAYAELLQLVYPVVKTANPHAKLLLGGLALDWFVDKGGCFDPAFFDEMLQACQGRNCFDVMNFHYFPLFRPRWEPYGADIIGKTNYVRQKLAAHGLAGMPIICTETSWDGDGTRQGAWGNQELQTRYVVKGYARGLAAGLEIISWYFIQDGQDPMLPGLLDNKLDPKLSYYAYQNMTLMLQGAYFQRALTLAETGSAQLVGYVFVNRAGRRLDVVWTEDSTPYNDADDPYLPLTVRASKVRVVDKLGQETWIRDGDDGKVDGLTTVVVGGSPLYLEHYP